MRNNRYSGSRSASIQVATETGKVAAGDVEAHPVTCLENISCSPKVNIEFVYLAGTYCFGLRTTIAGSNDSISNKTCITIRVNILYHRLKVGIVGRRLGKELDAHKAGYFEVFRQGR